MAFYRRSIWNREVLNLHMEILSFAVSEEIIIGDQSKAVGTDIVEPCFVCITGLFHSDGAGICHIYTRVFTTILDLRTGSDHSDIKCFFVLLCRAERHFIPAVQYISHGDLQFAGSSTGKIRFFWERQGNCVSGHIGNFTVEIRIWLIFGLGKADLSLHTGMDIIHTHKSANA